MAIINSDKLLERVIDFYGASHDFNGYPLLRLSHEFVDFDQRDALTAIHELVSKGLIDIEMGDRHPNPHIKAFQPLPADRQAEKLSSVGFSTNHCLYPSIVALDQVDVSKYSDRPFSRLLARGFPQLDFRSFELAVLEFYRNDPRYTYECDSIHGWISVSNEFHESAQINQRDQILLKSFGFAFAENMDRFVAVFLRYLSDLSPEHQQVWNNRLVEGDHFLHPDYYRSSIIGDWPEKLSIFSAFTEEITIINQMCNLMGKPPLFRRDFREDRPREFAFLIRPTLREFNQFALLLDKMLSDNLDKAFFGSDVYLESESQRADGKIIVQNKGTIALLEEWVGKYYRADDHEALASIVKTFRRVRNLRQQPAHAINEDQFDQVHFKNQRELMKEAYNALRTIRLVFASHPLVARRPPHINDLLDKGEIWTS